ncbi:MAG: ComEC/Rec2 family competence protein [bacterium]|nr:ComEC/Rec2 family competence protein [bacterium]
MTTTLTDKIFYLSIAGFVAGIFAHSFVQLGSGFSLFVGLLGVVLFILPFLKGVPHSDEGRDLKSSGLPACAEASAGREDSATSFRKGGILLAVFLLAVGFGMWRYDIAEQKGTETGLESSVGQTVTLEGLIADEPDVREATTRLILEVDSEDIRTRILLMVSHEPRYSYGDRIQITGKLERPKNFTDEKTLREVDYISHLEKDGIFYQMFRPKITLLASGEGNVVIEKLFAFKNVFIGNINTLIVQPHASLLGGLVVGAKQSLGKELLDNFRIVGVIHIVVLSGYNITIIAVFIEWLLSRLRKNLRLIFAAIAMTLFAIMVGASATVIRATVMALLVLLARGTGRIYQVTRALLVAGVIMLLHNPKILVFDTSFQLSFLATVGLIYVSPFIEPKVKWVTERFHMREIVVATVATQLFVLPFLLYKTGVLSVVSLPVNLLVLAAIPLTMLFGFAAGMVAFISSALALPFAYIAYAFLSYELTIVEWFARLPFAAVSLPYFPLWLVVLWYTVYAALYFVWGKKQSTGAFKESLLI